MSRREKHRKKTIKINIILILLLVLICGISFVAVFGRYITNTIRDNYFSSREFYFYSDKLTLEGTKYRLENWSGVDDYTLTINMNSIQNNLKKVNYDIEYNIECTYSDNVICTLSKTEGTIYSTTNTDYFNLRITPNTELKDNDKVTISVTATSKGPYVKTLTAEFELVVGQEKLSYEIQDEANSQYLELNITNTLTYYLVDEAFNTYKIGNKITNDTYMSLSDEQKEKCHSAQVTLKFNPEEVLLDMTNYSYINAIDVKTTVVQTYTYINEITFNVDAVSSSRVRFYKQDVTKDYSYPNKNNENSIITVTSR